MKQNTFLNYLQITRRTIYFAALGMIGASAIYLTVPFGTKAQISGGDDSLKPSGEKVVLSGSIKGKNSDSEFAQLKAESLKSKSSVAKTKTAAGAESTYYFLQVEYRTAASRKLVFTDFKKSNIKDVWVLTAIDRFADIFLQTDAAYAAVKQSPNVLSVEICRKVVAPPPPPGTTSIFPSEAVPERIARGGYKAFTGKNVIIAVLDTGIDFRHPDFITNDASGQPTSRIAYLWDTSTVYQSGRGSVAPVKFPNGTSIGTLYTGQQLTNELRSSTINIPPTDLDGHGTACASVAAGNGNADRRTTGLRRPEVVGVAPEATIIGVRLGVEGLENGFLLNAISEWLETVAGKTPLVISGSFGGHYTGHDGQRIEERELNARFPLTSPGRAIVFAAGNEGDEAIHAKANFSATSKLIGWNAKEQTDIHIYFDSADQTITLTGAVGTTLGKNLSFKQNPITNQIEATLTVVAGLGGVWLQSGSGKPAEAHLYFLDRDYGTFLKGSAVQSHLVGSPGTMENAITVGSYDWNDNFHKGGKLVNLTANCLDSSTGKLMVFEIGWLSCYSSPGPTRTGSIKPDIVAPGEWFPSADAKANGKSAGTWGDADSTGFYRAMCGTSAATPYTSGVVALMFQKKPLLTLGEVKALFKGKATKTGLNPYTQAIPNNNWGYGKLDEAALDRIFAAF